MISEGLRYMVLPNTARYCTETYKIPDSDFTVPKGMKVIIPTVRPVFVKLVNVNVTECTFFKIKQMSQPNSILHLI